MPGQPMRQPQLQLPSHMQQMLPPAQPTSSQHTTPCASTTSTRPRKLQTSTRITSTTLQRRCLRQLLRHRPDGPMDMPKHNMLQRKLPTPTGLRQMQHKETTTHRSRPRLVLHALQTTTQPSVPSTKLRTPIYMPLVYGTKTDTHHHTPLRRALATTPRITITPTTECTIRTTTIHLPQRPLRHTTAGTTTTTTGRIQENHTTPYCTRTHEPALYTHHLTPHLLHHARPSRSTGITCTTTTTHATTRTSPAADHGLPTTSR